MNIKQKKILLPYKEGIKHIMKNILNFIIQLDPQGKYLQISGIISKLNIQNSKSIIQLQRRKLQMLDPLELENLGEDSIASAQSEIQQILTSLHKYQINSVQSMILPPMFTYNILKLVYMILYPHSSEEQITWLQIKKQLLCNIEILKRKCQNRKNIDFDEEDIEKFEKSCLSILGGYGSSIESKSQLYGSFMNKMVKFILRTRMIVHGSKYLRNED